MIENLIVTNRSYRRFVENETVSNETLRELVDLARLSASGANRQPLKYLLSTTCGEGFLRVNLDGARDDCCFPACEYRDKKP